jgi:dolichol-phosphate mannosyltransferase
MIYIILAIYNEEKAIPSLIKQIREVMENEEYKIVAIDDGSTDGSLSLLNGLIKDDIIIAHHNLNLSIGAVFLTAFNTVLNDSKNDDDVVVLMESDQTSSIDLLIILVEEIRVRNHDIAIASRFINGGGYVNFPFTRRIYSLFANHILQCFFPIPGVKDYTIFYRSYSCRFLKKLRAIFGTYSFIQFRGFISNSELLIKSSYFTKKIIEIPFLYDYGNKKGKSKLRPMQTIFEYLYFIFNMRNIEKEVYQKKL